MRIDKTFAAAVLAGLIVCVAGCASVETQGNITSPNPPASEEAGSTDGSDVPIPMESDPTMTSEIEAQFCEELRRAAKAGDAVAAYVDDIPIYKRQVEVGLAFSNQTNNRNLQIITDPAERKAYLDQYGKNYEDMLQWFINQEIGILEGKKAGIMLDEQQIEASARENWEQAVQLEPIQKTFEALGLTSEEYFEIYQLTGTRRSAYFNAFFESLLPSANYQNAEGGLDKKKRDGDIAEKLQELRKAHTVKIV
ncbi:MAG: hypothetical protein HFE86_00455 [Clostridiales bacterium]|nr:hypothetical protein [Clostridiales bacterium]